MESSGGTVASLVADYARDLAELEAIRVDLVAAQERVARLAATMTARQEKIATFAIALTQSEGMDPPLPVLSAAVTDAAMDGAPGPVSPVLSVPAEQTAPSSTLPATDSATTTDVEPQPSIADQQAAIPAPQPIEMAAARDGEASPGADMTISMETDAPAALAADHPRTESENASDIKVTSDESFDKAIDAMPSSVNEELPKDQSNDADLLLVSAPAAEPLRAVRPPEALPENVAQTHESLAPVVATESAPDDASIAKTAIVTAERASAEASVTLLNEGPAARSDDATSSTSRSDTASVDPLLRSAPVAGETAVQNPSATEAVALGQTQASQAPQSAASAAATGVVPKSVTAAAASTPPATAVDNVVALDAARLRASQPVRTKRRRRAGMAALLVTAAAFVAVVVTAGLYDLGKDLQIDRMTEIFSTAG